MTNMRPQIDGYHAHVYYEPASRAAAVRLTAALAAQFAVEVGGFFDAPVGPHPIPQVQIIFGQAEFAGVVPWLMLNRKGLDVLVHPLTDDSRRDHDSDGAWLGTPVPLKLHGLNPAYEPELLPSA
jgi:aromatic ring-cleaving dioxygenase